MDVRAVAEAYFNSDDRAERERLARDLLAPFLSTGDGDGLVRSVRGLDPEFLVGALHEAARSGADVPPIAAGLLAAFGPAAAARALCLHLEGAPEAHFPATLAALRSSLPATAELLPPLLERASELGLDVAPGLADVVTPASLRGGGLLHALRTWAKRGTDVAAVRADLEACLDGERSVAVLAASALTFSGVRRDRWPEVDRLVGHASPHPRWGAARALSEHLAAFPDERRTKDVVDRLARALADQDGRVRAQAFEGLAAPRKAGFALQPSANGLGALVASLGAAPQVEAQLRLWAERSAGFARQLRDLLGDGGGGEPLRRLCDDVAAGRAAPPCPLCSNLEDFECKGHEEDLPKEVRLLVPPSGEVRQCPTCRTTYHYAWHTLYDDEWGEYGTWQVRRQGLTPAEDPRAPAAAPAPPPDQPPPAQNPPSLPGLRSRDDGERRAAASAWADSSLVGHDIGEALPRLAELLDDTDSECRRSAFQALQWAADEYPMASALPALLAHLAAGRQSSEQVLRILQTMQKRAGWDATPALPAVATALGLAPPNSAVAARAVEVLSAASERGSDLSLAVPALEGLLLAPRLGQPHDAAVTLLVRHFQTRGEHARVAALLDHPRERVRKVARRAAT